MAIRHSYVNDYVSWRWAGKGSILYFQDSFKPNQEDTYIIIFGPDQDNMLNWFRDNISTIGGKIIYESPKAHNYNHPNSAARNTMIIFEFE